MTDNVGLRSMMSDLLSDMRSERKTTGQRVQLPPPQPGVSAAEPTRAQGGHPDFADLVTLPTVTRISYANPLADAFGHVDYFNLVLVQGWVDTDQGSPAQSMSSFRGGPSMSPLAGPQDGMLPTLSVQQIYG